LEKARQIVEGLRRQKELQANIDKLMARGERLLLAQRFPEAQVAFESVLRLDPGQQRAKEKLEAAERRTGEALFAKWLPNEGPTLSSYQPRGNDVEGKITALADGRSISVIGLAMDDREVDRVEFRMAGQLVADPIRPLPGREAGVSRRSLPFQREFPV